MSGCWRAPRAALVGDGKAGAVGQSGREVAEPGKCGRLWGGRVKPGRGGTGFSLGGEFEDDCWIVALGGLLL